MKKQKLLVLYLSGSSPDSNVIGWSLYDGTTNDNYNKQEDNEPPYKSGLDAMRDGWRVIKYPTLKEYEVGNIHETKYLNYELVLEKFDEIKNNE